MTDPGGRHRDPAAVPARLWPVVVLFGIAMAAVVVVVLWAPPDSPHTATVVAAVFGVLSPILVGVWVTRPIAEVRERVDATAAEVADVHEKVNGNMEKLIARIPTAGRDPE